MSDRVLPDAPCLICGAISRHVFEHQGYQFFGCQGCDHVFVHPMPKPDELVKVYATDQASIANSDSWTQVDDYKRDPQAVRDYYFRSRINWIIEHGALPTKEAAVLDVGCGAGMFLRALRDAGYRHLHGVDLSPLHCQFVREFHDIPCEPSLDSIPNGTFDLVNCCGVLEHVTDPVGFCKDMARKLKPNGRLVLQVPNYNSFYRRVAGRSWVWLIPPVHLQYFSKMSLDRAVAGAGLEATTRDSWYNGTYIYLLVYHLMRALGRPMVSTRRTGRPTAMLIVNAVESAIRIALFPIAVLARRRYQHNELDYIVRLPPEVWAKR